MRRSPGIPGLLLVAMAASPAWTQAPAKPPAADASSIERPAADKPAS